MTQAIAYLTSFGQQQKDWHGYNQLMFLRFRARDDRKRKSRLVEVTWIGNGKLAPWEIDGNSDHNFSSNTAVLHSILVERFMDSDW
jgi:hypothetical protein